MSRFTTTLIAAVAAAVAAVAVVALPAVGDSGSKGKGNGPDVSAFAACLTAHGLAGAPTTASELKPWIASKAATDPRGVKTALAACESSAPDSGAAAGPDVQAAITCVRSHGIDSPTAPEDFKRWLGEHQGAGMSKALENALIACKIAPAPDTKAPAPGKPDCGAPAAKTGPRAGKPKQPASPGDTNGA